MKRFALSALAILLALAMLLLTCVTFYALSRTDKQGILLDQARDAQRGWSCAALLPSGEVLPWQEELSTQPLRAVRERFAPIAGPAQAGLVLDCAFCGIEVFWQDRLLHTDFPGAVRGEDGFLKLSLQDFPTEDFRSFMLPYPENGAEGQLTIYSYFPPDAPMCQPLLPFLQSLDTMLAPAVVSATLPLVHITLYALMTLLMTAMTVLAAFKGRLHLPGLCLSLFYGYTLVAESLRSDIGFFSGLQQRAASFPVFATPVHTVLLLSFSILLIALMWHDGHKRGRERPRSWQLTLLAAFAFMITAFKNATELPGGSLSYLPTVFLSVIDGYPLPLCNLIASMVVYSITLLVLLQFARDQLAERQRITALLERSRFARENHALIMQADEESRRRNHEMRHHLQTLQGLLQAGETERAQSYIEATVQETDRMALGAYSQNVVVNSIVGSYLNRARSQGVEVHCHIQVPDELSMEAIDLNILLSNMLENAVEACLRMTDPSHAFIELTLRKVKRFLFVQCINPFDPETEAARNKAQASAQSREHGFGMDAMRQIAEKYASILQEQRKGDHFIVQTNLCLPDAPA